MATDDDEARDELDRFMTEIARETGGTLRVYPRPGRAVRRVVLRDVRDERGSQFEVAQVEDDGILRVIGHDQGPGVSEIFGDDITSYEWVYVIAPDRVGNLVRLLGGQDGDDVLTLLAAYHQQAGGMISDLLRGPEAAAEFSNWHS